MTVVNMGMPLWHTTNMNLENLDQNQETSNASSSWDSLSEVEFAGSSNFINGVTIGRQAIYRKPKQETE